MFTRLTTIIYFGIAMLLASTVLADVRVDMTREFPHKTQHIVMTFNDTEEFEMWLAMRLENRGCDPFVTKMVVDLRYND